ncbi:retrovirus-related pol polyprotein from transposon TNT 1-94, partial [Tanacetum coccineum]
MKQAVEQHRLESRTFEVKINQVLSENERLLAQAINNDIVKTIVNLSVNEGCETVNECQRCLELKTELLNKKDFVDKETYDKLCKSFTTLEKHCITLEADSQLNQENFQLENSVLNQNAPSFTQLFELIKMDMDEIKTHNIKLEHRVTKLVTENEHLKQTYKKLYDSIKPKRVQSKEQCDALIKQVNIKSGEISDLNAKLQEQGLVIAALKNELRKLKGKALDKEATVTHSVDPKVSKDNMEPITPKLLNKRTAHSSYIKHTQEEALVLKDIVEHVKANYPQDSLLESAFRSHRGKRIRELGVRLSTSASGSQPSGNTRNDRILQTPSSNSKNKVEAHPRNVKSSLNKRNGTVKVNGSAVVQNLKKQDNNQIGYIWKPTGRTFTIVGNACPLTRITTTNEVPSRKPIVLDSESPKPVVKLVYSRKPRKNKGNACPLTRITHTNEVASRTPIVLDYESPILELNWLSKSSSGFGLRCKDNGYGGLFRFGIDNSFQGFIIVEGLGIILFFYESTLSLGNMMASSPICLLSKASKTKSWLWHHRLSHLNFGAINHLARHGLVR